MAIRGDMDKKKTRFVCLEQIASLFLLAEGIYLLLSFAKNFIQSS